MNLRLGLYLPDFPPTVTPLGITVHTCGLLDYGSKRVRKTCQRMIEANVQPWIIEQFREWGLRLPAELPTWIDTAYTERMTAWGACIGHRLPNGHLVSAALLHSTPPTSIKVILHPEPFAVPQGKTAGASWSDRVEVVIAYLDQHDTWLRKCDDLIAWELGNLIGIRHGFSPRNVNEEIGNRSPCGL